MSEPTFTLEHDEQTWRVQISQGGKDYAIFMTRYLTGKISIKPIKAGSFASHAQFTFERSDPNVVLAIGRLLVEAARKAGADAA